ncbi:hypothetical protein [Caballeronia sp. SBC2]|uniref:hypothetical protein n=1 Tax=Caballeronia sp. SBC2 TaxID=2705547 RepID=UPI0013ED8A80|nr:hypothetical protein [Caballeronia sp. SBC2]
MARRPNAEFLSTRARFVQDWVGVRALANYRSPHDIVRFLGQVMGDSVQIEAASPIGTADVALVTYAGSNAVTETKEAPADMPKVGSAASDIAILTFQGRERTFFSMLDRLGNQPLRSFTGEYDTNGAPVYRAGEIRFDSVYRFKGQCAPRVILTESTPRHSMKARCGVSSSVLRARR